MNKALFIISQTGTDAPVVTETLYSTIGETPTFTYLEEGTYEATWPVTGAEYQRRICQVEPASLGEKYYGWKCSQHGDRFQQFDDGELTDQAYQCVLMVTMF